jgi:uncharacterized protein (TIGR02444 family)|tara:strand:+ start:274 stop:816 length:543 start_codon:yes stop_codon:yes gene_type:complete
MSESNHVMEDNPFWNFSLDFYGREGVADACLKLQDQFGADVNIVLYCCWVAVERAEILEKAELVEIMAVIEPWQTGVVQRLRQIRQEMKQNQSINFGELSDELRQAIKSCELDGEKIEQGILYQSGQREFSQPPTINALDLAGCVQIAETSTVNYLEAVSGDLSENGRKLIWVIAQALKV